MSDGDDWMQALEALSDEDLALDHDMVDASWAEAVDQLECSPSPAENGPCAAEVPADDWQAALADISDPDDDDDSSEGCGSEVGGCELESDQVAIVPVDDTYQLSHRCRHVADSALSLEAVARANRLLDNEHITANNTQLARALNTTRQKVLRYTKLLASCAQQVERRTWHAVEGRLAQAAAECSDIELLAYVEFCSYDTAKFSVTMSHLSVERLDDQGDAPPAAAEGDPIVPHDGPEIQEIVEDSVGPKKDSTGRHPGADVVANPGQIYGGSWPCTLPVEGCRPRHCRELQDLFGGGCDQVQRCGSFQTQAEACLH